jgi:hypothetical protein
MLNINSSEKPYCTQFNSSHCNGKHTVNSFKSNQKLVYLRHYANNTYSVINPPVFYNGSKTIPEDGKFQIPNSIWLEPFFKISLSIMSSVFVLLLITSAAIIYLNRSISKIRQRGITFLLHILVGLMFAPVAMVLYLSEQTNIFCHAIIWNISIGWALLNLSLIAREILLIQIFAKSFVRQSSKKLYSTPFMFIYFGIAIEIVRVSFIT